MANLFCGYACVVYAMRGEYETAAPFIGVAIVLDMLDGRIARLTGTASDFGVQFDSLADVISFGIAPAILSFALGPGAARAARLGGGLRLRDGGRDASRAVQHPKSGEAATSATSSACRVPQRRRFPPRPCSSIRPDCTDYRAALPALAMVLVPAVLMVSTIRFRSFKTIDLQIRRPYTVLLLIAGAIMLITTHPRFVLVAMAYTYLASAFIGMAVTRFRHRGGRAASDPGVAPATPTRDGIATADTRKSEI